MSVWRMEDVLELYSEPLNPDYPVVCFDERPCQLISETRTPLPMEPDQPQRYDYEYKREGTCNLFAFFQPLMNWRKGASYSTTYKSGCVLCVCNI